jgi:6-pyruvoyltetrahydropterin/6-carboxytetrahydropterin synthase
MFELSINGHIASAHFIKGYDGPCKDLHGHTWKVEATIASDKLDNIGLVADFKDMKKKLNHVLDKIDHVNLNTLPAFKDINPTTETIAQHIYREFAKECRPFPLKCVRVWESDTASITYYE